MKIFFTGGAGFIGSHLLYKLLPEGHEVFVLDDLSNGRFENIRPALDKVHFLQGTISHLQINQVPFIPDLIIHFAALGSVPRSIARPTDTFNANVKGSHIVFEAARSWGCKRVIYASSSSIYGSRGTGHRTEQSPVDPISPYAVSKAYGEMLAKSYDASFGIKSIGLRFFNVFGTRQRMDTDYAAAIPKFCQSLMEKNEINIFGDGSQVRTFTPVDFVVACTEQIINKFDVNFDSTEALNVTDVSYSMSVLDLAKKIIELSGRVDAKINLHPKRVGDVHTSIGYGQKLFEKIGTRPAHDLSAALKGTCEWYFNQKVKGAKDERNKRSIVGLGHNR